MSKSALFVVFFALATGLASTAQAGGGTIQGVVLYKGKAPARAPIDRKSDAFCAKTKMLSEKLVVNDGKLQDVHVGIKSGKAGKHKAPSSPVVVTQKACMYRPRVVGIMAGQALSITNGDQTMHNVHVYVGKQTWLNRGQPAGAKAIRSDAAEAGDVMTFKCDVHPWMRAYAVVTDHPYFDVTGNSGAFTIKDVPPGRYTLEAYHPELGKKKKRVTVEAGKTVKVEISFK
jgi:plastocyanin